MRLMLISMMAIIAVTASSSLVLAQEAESEGAGDLEQVLTNYLRRRLEQAELVLESLTRQKEAGIVTMPQVLDAEDEIDKWRLHLALSTEGGLVSNHPVLGEIRRELRVPEILVSGIGKRAQFVSSAIQEYLRKRLQRAERLLGSATLLHEMGRATESEVLAARSRVDGLNLLLQVERHNVLIGKE